MFDMLKAVQAKLPLILSLCLPYQSKASNEVPKKNSFKALQYSQKCKRRFHYNSKNLTITLSGLQPFERTAKDAESLEENLDQGGTACHIFFFFKINICKTKDNLQGKIRRPRRKCKYLWQILWAGGEQSLHFWQIPSLANITIVTLEICYKIFSMRQGYFGLTQNHLSLYICQKYGQNTKEQNYKSSIEQPWEMF